MVGRNDRTFDQQAGTPSASGSSPAADQGVVLSTVDGMEIMCGHIREARVSIEIADFISSPIRASSQRTYSSAWGSGSDWCRSNTVDPLHFSESSLINYLWFLFSVRHLSASTFTVHRAAIGSLLDLLGSSVSSKLISHFMQAVFLSCSPVHASPHLTWDVAAVLEFLRSWGPLNDLSLTRLSWCTFALVLLFSCRCIGDLVFLSIDALFSSSEDSITLQLGFDLKQSHPSH